jgi:hypothetical protein
LVRGMVFCDEMEFCLFGISEYLYYIKD